MGCDIHAYIDFQRTDRDPERPFAINFAELHIGRDYALFAVLAGVRQYADGPEPVVGQKGLPETVSYAVRGANELYVVDDKELEGDEGVVLRSTAEKWVDSGSSEWVDEDKKRVTHPDWHSHSWLTTSELEAAINKYEAYYADPNHRSQYRGEKVDPEVRAALAAMKALEADGTLVARFVFWFDN